MAQGTEVGSIYYDLDLDDTKFKGKAGQASKDVENLGFSFDKAVEGSKVFALGVAAAGTALVGFGVSSLNAYQESARMNAQLDAVLKSTKDLTPATKAHAVTVGLSADKHKELADKLATAKDKLDDLNHSHAKGEDSVYKHDKAVKQVTATISELEGQLGKTSTAMVGGYIPRIQMSKDALIALSKEIQRNTTIGDEAALAAINMGLTFTNIGKDQFPAFTKAVVDTAYAMNSGLRPSAEQLADTTKQLGKALQDPEQGLGALHRVGVNTDELAIKFKTVTDIAERQKLIIGELMTEFGGSGAAQLNTFGGQLDHVKEIFNDFQELVGQALADKLKPLIQAFDDWFTSMGGVQGLMDKFNKEIFPQLQTNLPIIIGFILGGLAPALLAAAGSAALLMLNLLPFILIGTALGLIVKLLLDHFGGLEAIMTRLQPIIDLVGGVFRDLILPQLQAIWNQLSTQLLPALQQLWTVLEPVLMPVLKFLAILLGSILLGAIFIFIEGIRLVIAIITEWVKQVKMGVDMVFGFFKWLFDVLVGHSLIPDLINGVVDWFKSLPGMIISALSNLWDAITSPFRSAFNEVKKMAEDAWQAIQKVNPLHRNSPSLVDNVIKGLDIIKKEYASLGEIQLPNLGMMSNNYQPALATVGSGGSGVKQDINIYVDKVGGMQDVQAIGRELGFRAGMMPQ
jgi:hypothetical protein